MPHNMTQVIERIATLEVKVSERWDAHDKRSIEQWTYVRTKLDELSKHPSECESKWRAFFNKQIVLVCVIVGAIASIVKILTWVK